MVSYKTRYHFITSLQSYNYLFNGNASRVIFEVEINLLYCLVILIFIQFYLAKNFR